MGSIRPIRHGISCVISSSLCVFYLFVRLCCIVVLYNIALIDAVSFMLANECRDQRIYKASIGSKTCDVQPLTAADSKLRFADAVIDTKRNRLIAVCEDHSKEGEPVNTISSVGMPLIQPRLMCQLCLLQSAHCLSFTAECLGSPTDFPHTPLLQPFIYCCISVLQTKCPDYPLLDSNALCAFVMTATNMPTLS